MIPLPILLNFFLLLIYCSFCICNPILMANNPSAVPVQNFDFVYIPKDVVLSHLPAFDAKKLKLEAEIIAKKLKINEKKFPLNCTQNQLRLVNWYKQQKISQKDPKGETRQRLKMELAKLNSQLEILIPQRKNLIIDIQRLQKTVQNRCNDPSITRLSDFQFNECKAMKEQVMILSRILMDLNENERVLLQRERDIRKQFTLL